MSSKEPAPAPLPEEVLKITAEREKVTHLRKYAWCYHNEITGTPFIVAAYDGWPAVLVCITDLSRRLAEAEAENGRFAEMLESSVSDWRKLYTEERAERVRIQGILLNDVQAERQESDEHINGLNVVIKTQDKTIRDLKSRVELAADWQVQFAKAEARVRELEVDNREVTHEMLCIKAERDALRGRCEKFEWLVEVQEFYMYRLRNPGGWSTPGMERAKIGVAWQRRSAANDELRAMYMDALAATEAK